jgi:hypothetical protein
MSVTINAKGTSMPAFKVGKNGTVISQAGEITPPTDSDLILNLDIDKFVVVNAAGSGPALITASDGQDLHINPATGGGQYLVLNACRWPTTDGAADQILTTNGLGVLGFQTLQKIGSPSPSTSATAGFAYMPVMAGTPTGTPDTKTGYVPFVADSSGNKLWVFIGGVWKYATLS